MGKWLIGALLAATAWTPMAEAQEGGWRGRRAEGQQPAPQPQGGGEARRGWGGQGQGGQFRGPDRPQRAQGSVEAQVQQPQRGWQARGDVAPQAFGGRDRNGDGRPDGFARDRNGDGRPDTFARDRNGDGRPDSFARDRNGDGRPDGFGRDGRGFDPRNGANGRYDARRYGGERWNGGWRQDNRYDWNRYRSYNRNAYRLPRYYAPYGWNYGYRRFSIGVVLTSGLWGQNYWIDDPYEYRLPEAYGPYRWVRYYNDALLVDVRYGEVVDVIYDIFW